MNHQQRLDEIRKELAINGRLRELIIEAGHDFANEALRKQYHTNDAAMLIRQAGLAEGAEKFIDAITKSPKAAQPDRPESLATRST